MAQRREFEPDAELSEICTRLWEMDENMCIAGEDYELDLQGFVKSARYVSHKDWAKESLFSMLDEDTVFGKPTYKAFRALLDNYETETGRPEEVTEDEFREEVNFINLICETAVMQEAHRYLVEQGKAPEDVKDWKRFLYNMWFKLYRRLREDRSLDSSGFEHVFVGESRGQDIIGFHNWIQFYLQEKSGHVDYRGYFRRGTTDELEESPRLITLQFIWKKMAAKPIGSSFVGTSPELEMALYTLVFLCRGNETNVPVTIGDYEVEIVCYPHGRGIGSTFPISKSD